VINPEKITKYNERQPAARGNAMQPDQIVKPLLVGIYNSMGF
jgi:hypothetical protein